MSNYLFYCKTTEGYIIKSLCELLKNNIKQGCFTISSTGINFRMTDSNSKILIDINLLAENFSQYKFTNKTPFSIGLNMNIFYNLVREIKKKDSISLYIHADNQTELHIGIIPKDTIAITTGTVKIQSFITVDILVPTVQSYHVYAPKILQSNGFAKIIKSLSGTNIGGSIISISSNQHSIQFLGSSNGLCSRNVLITNDTLEPTGCTTGGKEDREEKIHQDFETEQLIRISKIASLSSQLQCYQHEDLPLFLKSLVGNLGTISIFLKDKSQYE